MTGARSAPKRPAGRAEPGSANDESDCRTNGIRIRLTSPGQRAHPGTGQGQGPRVGLSSTIYITASAKRHDEGRTSAKAGLNRTDERNIPLDRHCDPGGNMQHGSLIRSIRKYGPDVWQFRWSETGANGQRVYRKRVIGTVEQYSDAVEARRFAAGRRHSRNTQPRRSADQTSSDDDCGTGPALPASGIGTR